MPSTHPNFLPVTFLHPLWSHVGYFYPPGFPPCLKQSPLRITLVVHPSCLHFRDSAPCLRHTPPFWDWLVHPSWLQTLLFAPCLQQTPPRTVVLKHPSWLQPSRLYPCRWQTPRTLALLVHPSWLHSIFVRCLQQTPPYWAWLVQPSWLHILAFAAWRLHTPSLMTTTRFVHPPWVQNGRHVFVAPVFEALRWYWYLISSSCFTMSFDFLSGDDGCGSRL